MKSKLIFTLFVLLVLISSCSETTDHEQQTLNIGVILPLTGTSADAGNYIKNGLDLALGEINSNNQKYRYKLLYEDSMYDPKIAVNAFNKLTDVNDVNFVVGAHGSSETLAIAPIAEEKRVILITPGSQSDEITNAGDYIFRTQTNTKQESEFFAEQLYKILGKKSLSLLLINTAYGTSFENNFVPLYKSTGGNIQFVKKFDSKESDYKTYLYKLKDSDAVLIGGIRKQAGLILKQAKDLKLNITFFATSPVEGEELIDIAGDSAEGLIYPYSYDANRDNPETEKFREMYITKFGEENEMLSANGYDTLNILTVCIDKVGDNVDLVKDCLYGTKDYKGAGGTISFDKNGDVNKKFIVKTVKDGKFVEYEESSTH